jgi:hypothetical protein
MEFFRQGVLAALDDLEAGLGPERPSPYADFERDSLWMSGYMAAHNSEDRA